jgi:hypothetical protein
MRVIEWDKERERRWKELLRAQVARTSRPKQKTEPNQENKRGKNIVQQRNALFPRQKIVQQGKPLSPPSKKRKRKSKPKKDDMLYHAFRGGGVETNPRRH